MAQSDQRATTNVGSIWERALKSFESDNPHLENLEKAHSVVEVLSEIRAKESSFKHFRHDKSKLDKFRTLVRKSLEPVDTLCNIGSSAASDVSL